MPHSRGLRDMTAASEQRQQRMTRRRPRPARHARWMSAPRPRTCGCSPRCTGLIYLSAPVLYVGVTQASLCSRLGRLGHGVQPAGNGVLRDDGTAGPHGLASRRSSPALRRNLILCFMAPCGDTGRRAAPGLSPLPRGRKVAMVVVQGAVSGATGTTARSPCSGRRSGEA